MDCSRIGVNTICKVGVWDTFSGVSGWKKLPALYLGQKAGKAQFAVWVEGQDKTDVLDETLAGYTARQDHWVVYSDAPEHIVERVGYFSFVNTLGIRKTSYAEGTTEAESLTRLARQAGLVCQAGSGTADMSGTPGTVHGPRSGEPARQRWRT